MLGSQGKEAKAARAPPPCPPGPCPSSGSGSGLPAAQGPLGTLTEPLPLPGAWLLLPAGHLGGPPSLGLKTKPPSSPFSPRPRPFCSAAHSCPVGLRVRPTNRLNPAPLPREPASLRAAWRPQTSLFLLIPRLGSLGPVPGLEQPFSKRQWNDERALSAPGRGWLAGVWAPAWAGERGDLPSPSHAPHNCLSLELRILLGTNSVSPMHHLFPGAGVSKG